MGGFSVGTKQVACGQRVGLCVAQLSRALEWAWMEVADN